MKDLLGRPMTQLLELIAKARRMHLITEAAEEELTDSLSLLSVLAEVDAPLPESWKLADQAVRALTGEFIELERAVGVLLPVRWQSDLSNGFDLLRLVLGTASYCQVWCTRLESSGFPADLSLIDPIDEFHSCDDVGKLFETA